ncbi:MAG: hypothetical protein ACE5KM_09600 [Planctomycetaceae bacterium]
MSTATTQPSRVRRMAAGLLNFFVAPASPRPLAVLRIGVAAVLLAQAFALANHVQELFGRNAVVTWSAMRSPDGRLGYHTGVPTIEVLAKFLAPFGATPEQCTQGVFIVYVFSLACLLIGWRSHLFGVLAWITHLSLCASSFMTIYGVDQFANIFLFYLAFMPAGKALSVDNKSGRLSDEPTVTARIWLRVLQLHLCIAYVASGIDKGSGEQWWNGEAIWRSVTLPELATFDMTWMASVPWLAMLLGFGTLFLEFCYPLILLPKLRKPMALGILSLHVGIAICLGLISFSALMFVFTFSAFMISGEPVRKTIAQRTAANATDLTAAPAMG